jgi:chromosomal replication initiation ATPase DnaA
MELELCPNCNIAVVLSSPECRSHRCGPSQRLTATPPRDRASKKVIHRKVDRLTLDELADIVVAVFDIEKEGLCMNKSAKIVMARELFMYIGYLKLRYTQSEIAQYLDSATSGVSAKVKRVRSDLSTNPVRRQFFNQIMSHVQTS